MERPLTNRLEARIDHQARNLVRPQGWLGWLARAGYATRGFLYAIIGGLSALTAVGSGGRATDSKGALIEIYQQPFGRMLLLCAGVGLVGYAAFRFYTSFKDPERQAQAKWGIAKRVFWFAVGLLHLGLALFAFKLQAGGGGSSGGADARSGTASVLAWPAGTWLVGAVGVGLLIGAAQQLWCAWRAKLDERLDLSSLQHASRTWVVRLSRAGIASRALVAAVAGVFLIIAANHADPGQAKGFGEALGALRQAPFGAWLFAAVSVGLIAYGFYQFVEARYRRVPR